MHLNADRTCLCCTNMDRPILETKYGALFLAGGGERRGSYLTFAVAPDAPIQFWEVMTDLEESIHMAGVHDFQVLINQGVMLRRNGAHIQVRVDNTRDLERLLFSQPPLTAGCWADD